MSKALGSSPNTEKKKKTYINELSEQTDGVKIIQKKSENLRGNRVI